MVDRARGPRRRPGRAALGRRIRRVLFDPSAPAPQQENQSEQPEQRGDGVLPRGLLVRRSAEGSDPRHLERLERPEWSRGSRHFARGGFFEREREGERVSLHRPRRVRVRDAGIRWRDAFVHRIGNDRGIRRCDGIHEQRGVRRRGIERRGGRGLARVGREQRRPDDDRGDPGDHDAQAKPARGAVADVGHRSRRGTRPLALRPRPFRRVRRPLVDDGLDPPLDEGSRPVDVVPLPRDDRERHADALRPGQASRGGEDGVQPQGGVDGDRSDGIGQPVEQAIEVGRADLRRGLRAGRRHRRP